MSSTVTISPALEDSGIVTSSAGAAAVAVSAAVAAVLTDDADANRMLEEVRRQQQADRLASIRLRTPDLGRLVQSAREANFKVREMNNLVRIEVPGVRESVWATRSESGLALVGGRDSLQRVLVANTVSRLSQPLSQRGFTVQRQASGGRDLDLVAINKGNRELRITVASSGDATVDALDHHGKECEEVVRDLAAAVDGRITACNYKPEYFGGASVRMGTKQRA